MGEINATHRGANLNLFCYAPHLQIENGIQGQYCSVLSGSAQSNFYVELFLPHLTSTLMKTMSNPMWKIAFGTTLYSICTIVSN